jgi:hypothetical protein
LEGKLKQARDLLKQFEAEIRELPKTDAANFVPVRIGNSKFCSPAFFLLHVTGRGVFFFLASCCDAAFLTLSLIFLACF